MPNGRVNFFMKCYLCKSETNLFIHKNGYAIYKCVSCGLARTDLKQKYSDFVEKHYNKGYFTGDPTRSAYINYKDDKQFILKNMHQFMSRVKAHKPKGKLLDVGCALGFFVELAKDTGYDAYGFDPSSYAVDEAKKLVGASRIKRGTISSVKYPKKSFDVITMFDVFEHLSDPGSDMQKLSTLLKDDGVMVIATGDTNSLLAKTLKRRWTFYIPPQHLFFFNKSLMTELLAKYKLKPIEWFRIGKWLSLRYVLHLAKTTGESRIAHMLYMLMGKLRLEQLPLYLPVQDNMVTIVKKYERQKSR